jgi:hypothetical protein
VGRSPGRAHLARASALAAPLAPALALLVAVGAASSAAAAGWGHPFRIAGPSKLDVIPAQIAFSRGGTTALGYGVQDEDNPASSNAFAVQRSARGRISAARRIRGAQEVLALAYNGTDLELLTGTSPKTDSCCSSVSALHAGSGDGFGSPQRLLSGLAGATIGRLVPVGGGLLASFATEHGVWVAQSPASGRFGPTHRLTAPSALPESLDATSLPGGNSIVIWTARPTRLAAGPTRILAARGALTAAPRGAATVARVPSDHRIDEIAVAPGAAAPTVAWIESWFDSAGVYYSQAVASDVRRGARARVLSAPDALAAGLSLAGDARGDEAVAWKECAVDGDCALRAALRPAGRAFSATAQLPRIDASQAPALAVSSRAGTLLAWIQQGHVLAVQAARRTARFGPAQLVSSTRNAADLTVAFGAGCQALAAWTQGTLNQSLMGAVFRSR